MRRYISSSKGVILNDDTQVKADYVIINADFAHAMVNLVNKKDRNKYTDTKVSKMKYSCSTFMLYLGINKVYENLNHHNIFFGR